MCHIAGEMITALQAKQRKDSVFLEKLAPGSRCYEEIDEEIKKEFITEEDVMSVKVAALCHDLGNCLTAIIT